jgi:hypothetical protein
VVVDIPRSPTPYNIILRGATSNGSFKLYGMFPTGGLYLNGVNITNPRGPAINIQSRRAVPVHLVGGCGHENFLADGPVYDPPPIGAGGVVEQAKGTFFSEVQLTFLGSGVLEMVSKFNHAIVVDSDLRIESGNIIIRESVNDGIHTNNSINITGGNIQIVSVGDAIQNERMRNTVHISGGRLRLRTSGIKSHGIAGEDTTIISGNADIVIHTSGNGAKGIRTRGFMGMRGGTVNITVVGARHVDHSALPPDSSNPSGIKVGNDMDNHPGEGDMEITGGTLTINARGARNGRGLNIDGNLNITNGNVNITADNDGIRTRGDFVMTGGTVRARSTVGQDVDCRGRFIPPPGLVGLDAPNRREGVEGI